MPLEVILDLRARTGLAGVAEVGEDRGEERRRPRRQIVVDRLEGRDDARPALLRVQQPDVDGLEEGRIELHRLRDDFAIRDHPGADDFNLRQRRRGVQDPERRVVEVAARDQPLVRLVDRRDGPGGGPQKLDLLVAGAELVQPFAQPRDRGVVGVEEAALGEQRVHERVLHRALDHAPELGARNQEGVHVDALGVERHRSGRHFAVVDRHEDEVDVGLRPDGIVGQAAAEERGQDAAILPHLGHEGVEGGGECLPG